MMILEVPFHVALDCSNSFSIEKKDFTEVRAFKASLYLPNSA
jgi:hypothetical protein